jgi:hypothetical protein
MAGLSRPEFSQPSSERTFRYTMLVTAAVACIGRMHPGCRLHEHSRKQPRHPTACKLMLTRVTPLHCCNTGPLCDASSVNHPVHVHVNTEMHCCATHHNMANAASAVDTMLVTPQIQYYDWNCDDTCFEA